MTAIPLKNILGVPAEKAGRAFHCNPSLRDSMQSVIILIHKPAMPGFPFQSLTQIEMNNE